MEEITPMTRRLNLKSGSAKVIGIVRESYLRSSLSCGSSICFEEKCAELNKENKGSLLPKDVTHYLVPMLDVARDFIDVLESKELSGMIFLQTVVNAVQVSSWTRYKKLCNVIRDPSKGSVFFPNEFFRDTFCQRESKTETIAAWQMRSCYKAVNWYFEHLGGQKPLIIITENQEFIQDFKNKRLEIFVTSLGDYLQQFWPNLQEIHTMYESTQASLSEKCSNDSKKIFEDHLKPDVIEAGIRRGTLFPGRLFVNRHHPGLEAVVHVKSSKHVLGAQAYNEILITGKLHRNRAIDGDEVIVRVLPRSEWKSKINRLATHEEAEEDCWDSNASHCPTGQVVAIRQRSSANIVAALLQDSVGEIGGGKRLLVCPFDRRIPKIRVMTSQAAHLLHKRIVVKIDNWPTTSLYPNGHFVKTLGEIGDLEAELKALLVHHNLHDKIGPFSQGVMSEMPPNNWKPDENEIARRKDFRKALLVMSIDPKGCQDVDDALAVKYLPNGNIQLGVFIADVAFFVKPNSFTDVEAQRRASTVYLADRRYDMLPAVLSANVCSLLSETDRYAMSVVWELEPVNCQVIGVWYGRSVIRSSYKLTYEVAQDIINGKGLDEVKSQVPELLLKDGKSAVKDFAQLKESLLLLSKVAKIIQKSRESGGALHLESAEVTFDFDKSSLEDIQPKQHLDVHETVAECMIFANQWVAKKISKSFPDHALLRRHPQPANENFDALKRCAMARNWRIETWSNKTLAESLDKCHDSADPLVNFLLRSMATRAMVQAVYFSTGSVSKELWEHYGLALQHYTHFTSPIRRYADIIVHRLLLEALDNQDWWKNDERPQHLIGNSELQRIAEHINERNKAVQLAQRESQELFQTLYFKDKDANDPRCRVEAIILSFRSNGFLIFVPRYALKGPVYLQDSKKRHVLWCSKKTGPEWVPGGSLLLHDYDIQVETTLGTQTYKLFDHVIVIIQLKKSNEDLHANALSFSLVEKVSSKSGDLQSKGEVDYFQELKKIQEVSKDVEKSDKKLDANERSQGSMYGFFQEMIALGIAPMSNFN